MLQFIPREAAIRGFDSPYPNVVIIFSITRLMGYSPFTGIVNFAYSVMVNTAAPSKQFYFYACCGSNSMFYNIAFLCECHQHQNAYGILHNNPKLLLLSTLDIV